MYSNDVLEDETLELFVAEKGARISTQLNSHELDEEMSRGIPEGPCLAAYEIIIIPLALGATLVTRSCMTSGSPERLFRAPALEYI